MDWQPIEREELQRRIERGLAAASDDVRRFFAQIAREPVKWQLHPWGDRGGGFWIVAVHGCRVVWFNDIEDGFDVATFETEGVIPPDQYACNQDELEVAVGALIRSAHREWLQAELHALLRALAAPGPDALAHEPEGTGRPEELAFEYDNFHGAFVATCGESLTPAQIDHLARVAALFEAMSGSHNATLWTEPAVCDHPRWAEVRLAARQALAVLGWSVATPSRPIRPAREPTPNTMRTSLPGLLLLLAGLWFLVPGVTAMFGSKGQGDVPVPAPWTALVLGAALILAAWFVARRRVDGRARRAPAADESA